MINQPWDKRKADIIFKYCHEKKNLMQVADKIGLSPVTVVIYFQKIMKEKGVSTRKEVCIGE